MSRDPYILSSAFFRSHFFAWSIGRTGNMLAGDTTLNASALLLGAYHLAHNLCELFHRDAGHPNPIVLPSENSFFVVDIQCSFSPVFGDSLVLQ